MAELDPAIATVIAKLSPRAGQTLQQWATQDGYTPWRELTTALVSQGQIAEIEEAFGTELTFGTGGMRGPRGPGPGRINTWVVARATAGLVAYLRRCGAAGPVVIGHDARTASPEFADTAARVLATAGLPVCRIAGLASTPLLAFAVRYLSAAAGVMITASHNPPTDNGYKCYQSAGHQFAPPEDQELVAEVQTAAVPAFERLMSLQAAVAAGLVRDAPDTGPDSVRQAYLTAAVGASGAMSLPAGDRAAVRVLYTPLHGVGGQSVAPALEQAGFQVRVLAEQAQPDENFATLPGGIANPEEPATFALAAAAATPHDDVILASDPDADRLGAMVRCRPGADWLWLDGQQLMTLLADFAITRWAATNPAQHGLTGVVSRSLVTTHMVDAIARAAGIADIHEWLVGLKYTGRLIARLAGDATRKFVFGGEEAHGYLAGDYCGDKDAANAACLMAAVVAQAKAQGRTAYQHLLGLYARHGLFAHAAGSLSIPVSQGGLARANRILEHLRASPPRVLADRPVHAMIDDHRGHRVVTHLASGHLSRSPQDPGNVVAFTLCENGTNRLTVRPSGTEPKMKLYVQLAGPAPAPRDAGVDEEATQAGLADLTAQARDVLNRVIAQWQTLSP